MNVQPNVHTGLIPPCILVLRYHEQRIDLAKRMQPGAP